jgi:hypothetical protein
LQEGVKSPRCGVKPALEDADFQLRRCRQRLIQGGQMLVAASLGFHGARLCCDCPRLHHIRVIASIPELGVKGVLGILQLGLVGSLGITDLICHI